MLKTVSIILFTGSGIQEYLTPDEVTYFDKTGRWPKGRRPCILCHRAAELSRLVSLLEVSKPRCNLGHIVAMRCVGKTKILKEIHGLFQAAEDNVFRLKVHQCMAHLDLELVLARLPNLASLELIYG